MQRTSHCGRQRGRARYARGDASRGNRRCRRSYGAHPLPNSHFMEVRQTVVVRRVAVTFQFRTSVPPLCKTALSEMWWLRARCGYAVVGLQGACVTGVGSHDNQRESAHSAQQRAISALPSDGQGSGACPRTSRRLTALPATSAASPAEHSLRECHSFSGRERPAGFAADRVNLAWRQEACLTAGRLVGLLAES